MKQGARTLVSILLVSCLLGHSAHGANDSLVPAKTPFGYNFGIDYETDIDGRTGRAITADLNQITQYFELLRTYHDTADPNSATPTISSDELAVIQYAVNHTALSLVMGTYNSALVIGTSGNFGAGFMDNPTYTDAWVQMLISAFGSTAAVQHSLKTILLGNEVDYPTTYIPYPSDPSYSTYVNTWIPTALANLRASLSKAGLGNVPISVSLAYSPISAPSGDTVSTAIPQYISAHWSASWNGGQPFALYDQYSTTFSNITGYLQEVVANLNGQNEVFLGETGMQSPGGDATQEAAFYQQMFTFLDGEQQNGGITLPVFAFQAFDLPAFNETYGVFSQGANSQPTGLKSGITIPAWVIQPLPSTFTLSISEPGTGSGVVTSSPTGVNCGENNSVCSLSFAAGTQITLTASAASGSVFSGWSGGGCSGTGTCQITFNAATSVSATFTPLYTVTVTETGSGTVTSSPSGISCGSTCSASFASGTQVSLTASPTSGSAFTGWSGGGCSGTGTCQVTLNTTTSVTATFTQLYALGVTVSGSGVVTSSPSGISCGSTCSASFAAGTPVTLTASPNVGWRLSGWGGACSGTGSCGVTMNGAKSVSATFTQSPGVAGANTWGYTCNGTSFDNLAGVLAGTVAWTSTTSSAASSAGNKGRPVAGDIVEITNICLGDVVIATGGVTITNHNATYPSSSAPPSSSSGFSDGIDGEVEVNGASGVTLANLILEGPVSGFASGTSNFTGNEFANLYVHDGASATVQNAWIGPGPLTGILAQRAASVSLQNSAVSGNGVLGKANNANGIWADHGASITLGMQNGTQVAAIHDDGTNGATCQGYEVLLSNSSSADLFGGTITKSGANSCSALYGTGGSSARLQGATLSYAGGGAPTIQFFGSSSVWIEANSMTSTTSSINGGNSGVILVSGGGSVFLQGSTLTSASSSVPVVEASGSSSLVITGGDTIAASAAGGTAIEVDHSSSLLHRSQSIIFPGTTNAVETITGAGLVQEQSSIDLGQGLVSGSPSISWTAGSSGIQVQQNSSFRVSGGVSITGAVTITQGSNGFANTANGGSNAITSASCPFTSVPSSHWAAPTKVTPSVASATSYTSATSPQCLAF